MSLFCDCLWSRESIAWSYNQCNKISKSPGKNIPRITLMPELLKTIVPEKHILPKCVISAKHGKGII